MGLSTDELIERAQLGQLEYIAEGGQGKVYRCLTLRLPDVQHALAYKEFKSGQVATAGLEAIVGVRSRLSEPDRELLDSHAAWPIRLVRDQGRVCGLLMPLIPDAFVQMGRSITGSTLRPRPVAFKAAIAKALQAKVWPLLASGKVRPIIHSQFTAAHASQAHALMESNQHIGKIVLTWDQL